MQGFGDELAAVAERFRQQKQQQDAFDAEVIGRELNGQIAQAEKEAIQNAPADGRGLHDAMYGQARNGVVKPGLFDKIFDSTVPKMPESERARFIRQKEAMRLAGSARMAPQQYARRQDYEQAEWSKAQATELNAIAQSDPDDTATFEAIRQGGFDFIAKMATRSPGSWPKPVGAATRQRRSPRRCSPRTRSALPKCWVLRRPRRPVAVNPQALKALICRRKTRMGPLRATTALLI